MPSLSQHYRYQKMFCNIWFFYKNEACVNCGIHKHHNPNFFMALVASKERVALWTKHYKISLSWQNIFIQSNLSRSIKKYVIFQPKSGELIYTCKSNNCNWNLHILSGMNLAKQAFKICEFRSLVILLCLVGDFQIWTWEKIQVNWTLEKCQVWS